MEKVTQEEVNFDNLSEYSSAFPRYSYLIKGLGNTFIVGVGESSGKALYVS